MKIKELLVLLFVATMAFSCKEVKKSDTVTDTSEEMEDNMSVTDIIKERKAEEIEITPIEHATTIIEWNDVVIYIDPTGGAAAFEGQKNPTLILITDIHGDHLSTETLDALDTTNVTFIVPQAVADELPEKYATHLEIMENGASKKLNGITIEAIPMYNLRKEALKFHEKGRGNGYVLNIDNQRIYFSGDTEDIPEMRSLKNIDKAFVCMNLPYTMTVESAASAVLDFKPKQVYPYHYRGQPDVSDVAKFKQLVDAGNQDIEVVQLDWYPNDEY
ncbi:L-ascorbate metabolism protein UlaG (beta-lactamase superfamily) [Maribacter caenipelagi]|uniref:L-ascorbate metabolism protein UlaG (Beta-lactamase superfamily) n=1 Tax=Maribacter caenipelagi TaxID=1447781 RepID=A0A4R7CYS3_9FLAO|nr:MBL fold metallo-hydrolase [Maribacter caenipelagi]TDS13490.1 L-ascorbate metabolism protein UlaG (beta-lactamase superfamily) [Maribacter caenipelagi]